MSLIKILIKQLFRYATTPKIFYLCVKSWMFLWCLVRSCIPDRVTVAGYIIQLDYHHDTLFPSSIPPPVVIERANEIWKRRGIRPKQHLSEQRPGAVTLMERRAHSDRCEVLPAALPDDMGKQSPPFCTVRLNHKLIIDVKDLMIEVMGLDPLNLPSSLTSLNTG